jgi:hypothetical protein
MKSNKVPENLAEARPSWWTANHEAALSALTNGWQSVANLKEEHCVGSLAFCDLWLAGYCEKQTEEFTHKDLRPGAHIFYRLPRTLASIV